MSTRIREQQLAWGLLAPALVVLGAFGLFPIGYALYVSLHKWRIKKEEVVGFDHYVRAVGESQYLLPFVAGIGLVWAAYRLRSTLSERGLRPLYICIAWGAVALSGLWLGLAQGLGGLVETGDPALYNGFKVTFFYVVGTIPCQLSLAVGLAYLLFKITRARGAFRTLFFLPYVTPIIASAVVFRTIFSPHPSSLANRFWSFWGLENQRWLYESKSVVALLLQGAGFASYPAWVDSFFPSLALTSIILYNIWVYVGYDTAILLPASVLSPSNTTKPLRWTARVIGKSSATLPCPWSHQPCSFCRWWLS